AVSPHPFDVAAEGRRIRLQNLADLGGPGEAELGRHDQDVQLADLQAQRAQAVVVEVRDDPVQEAQAHGDAVLAMVSMVWLFDGLAMIVWPLGCSVNCIYKYLRLSRGISRNSPIAAASE